jgi:hypothetical protein
VCDKIGDIRDCFHEQGKVIKEILEVGTGIDKPKMGYLCRIKFLAYYFDKEIFDTSPDEGAGTIDLYLGDVKYIEGLWRGICEMRLGERAKIKIKKTFAFGRPGEVEKLIFPKKCNREKLTSKGVIYQVELVSMVARQDIDASGNVFKQTLTKPKKGEYELPGDNDELQFKLAFY